MYYKVVVNEVRLADNTVEYFTVAATETDTILCCNN